MNTKKILVFGAHPDDVEFGCGGLLIKEIKNGAEVKIIVGSLGESGTNGTSLSRKKEAQNSAKKMGASIDFINLGGDCKIEYTTNMKSSKYSNRSGLHLVSLSS